jgi:hypothetical protein
MNKVIFTFSIIISAGLGYFAGKNSNNPAVLAQTTVGFTQKKPAEAVDFSNTSQTMPENNFHAGAIASVNESKKSPAAPLLEQSAQQQIDAITAEYEAKQRSEEFTQWLTKNQEEKSWFDLGIEMRGRFDAEETDHSWALNEEAHLQSLFSQAPALAGVALKSTRCKSTQCQITISVMDQDHANEIAMAVSQVLGSEKTAQIIFDSRVQQGETILYVARNEKGFELN